jgi:hypothetical protein
MIMPVCPVTLRAVPCGPDGEGWEVCFPRKWFKRWGPVLLISLRIFSIAQKTGSVFGLPIPSLDMIVSPLNSMMSIDNSTQQLISTMMDKVQSSCTSVMQSESLNQWMTDNLKEDITNIDDIMSKEMPHHLTDDAYRSIHTFLTTGENLQRGPLEIQLHNHMTRELGEDGTVEWVSREGNLEWHERHRRRSL